MSFNHPNAEQILKRLEDARDAIAHSLAGAVERSVVTCCSCDHFNQASEICGKYNMRPPAKVIAFGCPAYENEIPF